MKESCPKGRGQRDRLGEMMGKQPEAPPERNIDRPAELGSQDIDKNLAHHARKLARMNDDEFETTVGRSVTDRRAL